MSSTAWEQSIEDLVKEIDHNVTLDQNFVYGYTDANLMASLTYGNLAVLTMEYFIVVFAKDKLLLLEVSMSGSLTGEYGVIPYADIESAKVKRGMLQYVITLKLIGEKKPLKLKCNRKMLNAEAMGMGWQKVNLEYLAGNDWDGLA